MKTINVFVAFVLLLSACVNEETKQSTAQRGLLSATGDTIRNCRDTQIVTGTTQIKETYNEVRKTTHDSTWCVKKWYGTTYRNKRASVTHDSIFTVVRWVTQTTYKTLRICDTFHTQQPPVTKNQTIFRIFTTGSTPIKDKIATYRRCGATHIRYTIQLAEWTGIDRPLQQYIDSGFQIHLNITWASGQPRDYPANLVEYKKRLTEVLNLYKNAIVVVYAENEPVNKDYYVEPFSDYFPVLKACIEVCNKYNKPVADGGNTRLVYSLYNYYATNPSKADSLKWLQNITGAYSLKSDFFIDNLKVSEDYINGIKGTGIIYANFHYKEPKDENQVQEHPSGILTAMINYLRQRTGVDVTMNEVGFKNQSETLADETFAEIVAAKIKYAMVFHTPDLASGEAGAKPLSPKSEVILYQYNQETAITNQSQ